MASFAAPQAPPKWNHTPEEMLSITKRALAQNKAVSDKVAALPEAECNFETVFVSDVAINCHRILRQASDVRSPYHLRAPRILPERLHSKELRDALNQAKVLQRKFNVEESMRLDVFKAKAAAEKNLRESGAWEKLSDKWRGLMEKMVLDGKRAGGRHWFAIPALI
ncbi:hypothetical protein DEU56DRAFT_918528 [Suillus clintonianus]|uniref:uncharacterized protein n=1 Tax=Suillus clintonianus TaxID=1904413 RepID=UPI001B87184B|nr:uncharacterized protein DEU56DRAFT_918528 [Suillus clintonianus]KAG2119427.1 hypothetical protein DEU56DRAFT_918528 [Suillus clintonianus]